MTNNHSLTKIKDDVAYIEYKMHISYCTPYMYCKESTVGFFYDIQKKENLKRRMGNIQYTFPRATEEEY